MKKQIHLSIDENIYKKLKEKSDSQHISKSSYISMLIAKDTREKTKSIDDAHAPLANSNSNISTSDKPKSIRIKVSGNAAYILDHQATKLGITPTTFINDFLINQGLNIIDINIPGLDDFIKAFEEYSLKVNVPVYILRNSSDGNPSSERTAIATNIDQLTSTIQDIYRSYKNLERKLYLNGCEEISRRICNGN